MKSTLYKVQVKQPVQFGPFVLNPNQDFDANHLPEQNMWLVHLGQDTSIRIPKDMIIWNITKLEATPVEPVANLETTGSATT
jgi:hypothetical protein